MTRQSKAIATGFTLLAIYLSLWFRLVSIPLVSPQILDQIVPVLPFNLLVSLGSYCLWELGMGILTFGECDEAHAELMKEIETARTALRAKGVEVD